jgi:hypothetical protein
MHGHGSNHHTDANTVGDNRSAYLHAIGDPQSPIQSPNHLLAGTQNFQGTPLYHQFYMPPQLPALSLPPMEIRSTLRGYNNSIGVVALDDDRPGYLNEIGEPPGYHSKRRVKHRVVL